MSTFADFLRCASGRSRLARKSLLFGSLAALSATTTLNPVNAQQTPSPTGASARTGPLGCDQAPARFGRLFPQLPAAKWPMVDVDALSSRVMADEEDEPTPENLVDDEENLAIDAGYTYVGQFIDHDLTLDPRPNDLTTPIDPTTLQDFRTPAFDLDSVYGGGPTASPQLYQSDGVHLQLGAPLKGSATDPKAVDLPRDDNGQARTG